MARIREMARRLGIVQVDAGPVAIALTFAPEEAKSLRNAVVQEQDAHWSGDRLVFERPTETADRIRIVLAMLEAFVTKKPETVLGPHPGTHQLATSAG